MFYLSLSNTSCISYIGPRPLPHRQHPPRSGSNLRFFFLNKCSLSQQLFILPSRVCTFIPLKLSKTLLQAAAVKSWAGKGNLIFCLFKRSEIHTTLDKLIQNVPLMQVCLSALFIDAKMILTHYCGVGGTLLISFMAVHKLKRLGPNASNSLMTHLFYDLFVSATHHITRNIFILSL